ncbi:MAG: YIP1 family protein [Aeromonadaceae bacterium]
MTTLSLNPWKSLWRTPSATFHSLLEHAPSYNVLTLAMLGGVGTAFGQLSGGGFGQHLGLLPLLLLCLLAGPLLGLAELYLGAWLIARIGRFIGGQGEPAQLRTVMAWAGLPNVVGLLSWLLMLAVLGGDLFMPRTPELMAVMSDNKLFLIAALLQMILGFWSIALLVIGVATAQSLAMSKALLNLLLAAMAAMLLLYPAKLLLMRLF